MICPVCGAEYRPGFTECSDCLVALVEPTGSDEVEPDERPADEKPSVPREPLGADADMVCPQCRAEYRVGFTECSDCLVPLVRPAPPVGGGEHASDRGSAAKPSRMVAVFVANGPAQVALVKSTLEAAGIPVLLRETGNFGAGTFGAPGMGTSGFIRPVEFQVRERDVDEARMLLEGLGPGAL